MMGKRLNAGVPASPSGHSRAEPEGVSVVPTSGPNAFVAGVSSYLDDDGCWLAEIQVSGGHELAATMYAATQQEAERLRDLALVAWRGQPDTVQRKLEQIRRLALSAEGHIFDLILALADEAASAIETQRATTAGRGPQDESATAATSGGDAQPPGDK